MIRLIRRIFVESRYSSFEFVLAWVCGAAATEFGLLYAILTLALGGMLVIAIQDGFDKSDR